MKLFAPDTSSDHLHPRHHPVPLARLQSKASAKLAAAATGQHGGNLSCSVGTGWAKTTFTDLF